MVSRHSRSGSTHDAWQVGAKLLARDVDSRPMALWSWTRCARLQYKRMPQFLVPGLGAEEYRRRVRLRFSL